MAEITEKDMADLENGIVRHDFEEEEDNDILDSDDAEEQGQKSESDEEQKEDPGEDENKDVKPDQEKKEPVRFAFKDEEAKDDDTHTDDTDVIEKEIVHRGQVVKLRLTPDQHVNMLQKAYDYDTKVGPHQRIAQIVMADPGAAEVLNNYLQGKMKPGSAPLEPLPERLKFKMVPFDDSKSPEEWLAANLEEYEKTKEAVHKPVAQVQPQQTKVQQVAQILMSRDPENFYKVAPHLGRVADEFLTKKQLARIENDMGAAFEFYDFAKSQILHSTATPAKQQAAPKTPSFRVRSGGGEAPQEKSKADYPWQLSNKDFDAELQKIKGY